MTKTMPGGLLPAMAFDKCMCWAEPDCLCLLSLGMTVFAMSRIKLVLNTQDADDCPGLWRDVLFDE